MADVAAAAGVSRATLYRYFPTREQLLAALTAAGLNEAATRLAEADLDAVPVPEAIARIARVVAAAGSKYAAVADQADPAGTVEQQIGTMIQAVLRRGIDDQTLRSDLTAGELGYLLGYLLRAAGRMAADHQAGTESRRAHHHTVPARHPEPTGRDRRSRRERLHQPVVADAHQCRRPWPGHIRRATTTLRPGKPCCPCLPVIVQSARAASA